MVRRKNIWFRCPACDGRLVVDSTVAGRRATCPECANDIPVPLHSTMLPAWLRDGAVYAAVALLLAGAAATGSWIAFSARETKAAIDQAQESSLLLENTLSNKPNLIENKTPASDAKSVTRDPELERENSELTRRYDELTRWMIENYQGKYPLAERLVDSLRLDTVTESGEVSPDLVEILRLTDEEKAQVQSVIDYTRSLVRQAERDLVTVTGQSELSISYEVPVFPEVGKIMRDDMFYSLEHAIGAPRFDRMLDVAGESMREEMHYFGEASRTLTFEIVLPANDGDHPPYLLIRDGWMVPDGDSVRVTTVKETAAMGLPDNYRDYRDWIPDNFSAYTLQ
ncbi:MAG: hypothetical protein ACO3ZG_03855 [Kiritimatiellia bacterium]